MFSSARFEASIKEGAKAGTAGVSARTFLLLIADSKRSNSDQPFWCSKICPAVQRLFVKFIVQDQRKSGIWHEREQVPRTEKQTSFGTTFLAANPLQGICTILSLLIKYLP
jgi:hypothetical protein